MSEPATADDSERDFIACPVCSEFVSVRASGVGARGSRTFVCAFCNHRFPEADAATLPAR
jgi:uncharacterized protein YbaR (Trm112 family)